MILIRTAFLLLGFTLFGGAVQAAPIDYERLDQRLEQLANDDAMVGLAVAVIENGEIKFARGYGNTRVGGSAVTADTVFRWASLSKGVASSTTVKLADEGRLSLTDKIASFGTSLRLPARAERKGTLDNLLSHMLGIVPNAYDTRLEDGRDPTGIRRSLNKLKAICTIGECHTYQNVAFDAVSEVIEAVTGTTYAQTVEATLFNPLGMTNATIGRAGLQGSPSWAEPHQYKRHIDKMQRRTVNQSYYRVPAAGGVNGSIRDLALFARAQMGLEPETLPQAVLDELHTPRVYTRREQSSMSRRYGGHLRDARYALGWRVYKYGAAGTRVVGHRGAVEGYRSMILFDPASDTGVVALWNSNSRRPVGIQFEVMDMAYGLKRKDWLQLSAGAIGTAP